MTINPNDMTITNTAVDLKDYRSIRNAIGGKSYEEVRPSSGVRIFVDAHAKLYPKRPDRFLIAQDAGKEPLEIYGTALICINKGKRFPEIVFPKEERVTFLDLDWRYLGHFVNAKAGRSHHNLNFQAILSDGRFVAATRVVLATFEKHIVNACPSIGICPMLELEISKPHLNDALDLYDNLLTKFGYADDCEEEDDDDEEGDEGSSVPNVMDQMRAYMEGK